MFGTNLHTVSPKEKTSPKGPSGKFLSTLEPPKAVGTAALRFGGEV